MAIAVLCPACGARIHVPDGAAAGQGKCPKCGTAFSIPGPPSKPGAAGPAPDWLADVAGAAPPMIRLSCPRCRKVLKATQEEAGRKIACSRCGQGGLLVPRPETLDGEDLEVMGQADTAPARFTCPHCGGHVSVPHRLIGTRQRCPACGTLMDLKRRPTEGPHGGDAGGPPARRFPLAAFAALCVGVAAFLLFVGASVASRHFYDEARRAGGPLWSDYQSGLLAAEQLDGATGRPVSQNLRLMHTMTYLRWAAAGLLLLAAAGAGLSWLEMGKGMPWGWSLAACIVNGIGLLVILVILLWVGRF